MSPQEKLEALKIIYKTPVKGGEKEWRTKTLKNQKLNSANTNGS
jgi:hypothetical protein